MPVLLPQSQPLHHPARLSFKLEMNVALSPGRRRTFKVCDGPLSFVPHPTYRPDLMPESKHLEGRPSHMATWEISDILEMLKSKVRRSAERLEVMDHHALAEMVLTLNEEIDDIMRVVDNPARAAQRAGSQDDEASRLDYERWKEEILTGQAKAVERSDIRRGLSFD